MGDKVFILYSMERKNFTAARDTKPRIIKILERFIVNII